MFRPALQSSLQPKSVIEEVRGIIQDVLASNSAHVKTFREEIFGLYLKESSLVGEAAGEEGIVGEEVRSFWCQNLESILRGFGSVQTKVTNFLPCGLLSFI